MTWQEARVAARNGIRVRRRAWPSEWSVWYSSGRGRRRAVGVLEKFTGAQAVVRAGEFAQDDWLADDWMLAGDAPPETREAQDPSITLTGTAGAATVELTCEVGDFYPAGLYALVFYLNGVAVGTATAGGAGAYSVAVDVDWADYAGRVLSWVEVRSSPPLPEWQGRAEWEVLPAAAEFFRIDLAADFPDKSGVPYHGLYGARTYGPYADLRFVYSHEDEPAWFDDDLVLNGSLFEADETAGLVGGGATTLLLALPAGQTFSVDIRNGVANCWAQNYLRLYNRPI